MFLAIANILSEAELGAARDFLAASAEFASGKSTAGRHAKQVKDNEQAIAESVEPVLSKVRDALLANPVFKAAAVPKEFVRVMVSRYRPGMHYGTHVDDPLMLGKRTDLSFTLFLSAPSSYEGGELVVEENSGERAFKLDPGSLVLYPTTSLHRVEPVTSGERLAIVGWVRSYLRDPSQRELLFDLDNTIHTLREANTARPVIDRLHKIRANLLRMWADD